MAQATIAKLPLRWLQGYLEQRYNTIDSRIWWVLSSKMDDVLGTYGAECLDIITATDESHAKIRALIMKDAEPELKLKDSDPDAFDAAMEDWKARNQHYANDQTRINLETEAKIKALDETGGVEVVTLEVNATQQTFIKRKWEALKELPNDRRSAKINRAIDAFVVDLAADKQNGKGKDVPKREVAAVK